MWLSLFWIRKPLMQTEVRTDFEMTSSIPTIAPLVKVYL